MRLTTTREAILPALEDAQRHIVPRRPILPVLTHVHLESCTADIPGRGAGPALRLSATGRLNLGHSARWVLPAESMDAPGVALLDLRVLRDAVHAAPARSVVTITTTPEGATVTAGRATVKVPHLDTKEFPPIDDLAAGWLARDQSVQLVCRMDAAALRAAIRSVIHAVDDQARPILSGVEFRVDAKSLTLTAVDDYRLATTTLPIARLDPDVPESIVIPAAALQAWAATRDIAGEATILARRAGGPVTIHTARHSMTSCAIDGRYPTWQTLIPTPMDRWDMRVATKTLTRAVDQVARAQPAKEAVAALTLNGAAILGTRDQGITIELPADWDGPHLRIGLSPRFLRDALATLAEPEVRLSIRSALEPVMITEGTTRHLIMPIRLA